MRKTFGTFFLAVVLMASACTNANNDDAASASDEPVETASTVNPMLAEWSGPFGGVPAFDRMDLADLRPAVEAGIAALEDDMNRIAENPEPPTFDNTLAAMEGMGADLDRVMTYFSILNSNMSSPEFREIQQELVPMLSAISTKVSQNRDLYERVAAVYKGDEFASLRPDQQRLVKDAYDGFVRSGVNLEGAAKERYAAINLELAKLQTQFANNVLADEEGYTLFLDKEQLGGLPDSFVQAAATLATERGREGTYAILNTRSSMDPFLTYSDERDLREQVWRTYYNRGDNGDEHDNNAIITDILKLRQERVQLLGFDNYAEWRLADRMAKTPERANELLTTVWKAAVARVAEEVADMQAIADAEGADITIAPWDYRYYAEKVRKAKYDLDTNELKAYLQLDKLREAMFMVAHEIFNFEFTALPDGTVPVFHPDVKVWEVTDATTGEHIGLWYLDPYARTGKRSGAWASSYRGHETYAGKKTVLVSNNSNFIKGAPGEPVLISWDDANTFFHEMGHALHALSSNVAYPSLNRGVRDYTEFQSQVLEYWLPTDRVVRNYLVHYETGEPIPDELVAKIKAAETFNQGFATTEYLASALIDMALHTADPTNLDPDAFERETLEKLGMPDEIVMRHRTPHFGHIFSGEGYSAGYYGYMWADVLTADTAEAFQNAPGGFYDKALAEKMVKYLFAPRNAIDPAEAYRMFRGRDADVSALMRSRGFPVDSP
jgi:peptidyl-dipeptidase Dcp